jgi:hypothetical protein
MLIRDSGKGTIYVTKSVIMRSTHKKTRTIKSSVFFQISLKQS